MMTRTKVTALSLLLFSTSTANANAAPKDFHSRFAGLILHGAQPAQSGHDARLHAKELLAVAQLTHAVIGGKADHGLCQSQAVEAVELPGGEAAFTRLRADVKKQGFKVEDIVLSGKMNTDAMKTHIFALEGNGHTLLALYSPGKKKDDHPILTLCQTR